MAELTRVPTKLVGTKDRTLEDILNEIYTAAAGTRFTPNVLAIGRNADMLGKGAQFGGGDPTYGTDGVLAKPDGHASWFSLQPSRNESSIEFNIYPSSAQGIATTVNGTSTITRNASSSAFDPAWIGKKFYFAESIYTVATVPDADTMTLTYVSGATTLPFGSVFSETYHFFRIRGSGLCSVSGSTVTRLSGDPFIPFVSAPFTFTVAGTARTVSAFVDINTYTLSAPPGDVSSAAYLWETDVNNQITTARVQKLVGSNEENLSIYADYLGYHIKSFFAGAGKERRIFLGTADQDNIVIQPNGDVTVGGSYGAESMRYVYAASVINRIDVFGGTAGFNPSLRARGTGNVGIAFDAQAFGAFTFSSGSFSNTNFAVEAATGDSYVSAISGTSKGRLLVRGAANANLELVPNGTGRLEVPLANVPIYANDAAAGAGGLTAGQFYRHADASIHIKL